MQAVTRGNVLLTQGDYFPLAGIDFGDTPAAGAHEFTVEHALNALLAAMIHATHKTEHVRSVMFAGVDAQLVFLEIGKN